MSFNSDVQINEIEDLFEFISSIEEAFYEGELPLCIGAMNGFDVIMGASNSIEAIDEIASFLYGMDEEERNDPKKLKVLLDCFKDYKKTYNIKAVKPAIDFLTARIKALKEEKKHGT